MYKNKLLRFSLILWCMLSVQLVKAQNGLTIDQIPNPQTSSNTYVSDPQTILNPAETDSLNHLLSAIRSSTGVQAAVVLVNDFDKQQDDFTFATQLFRKWGIGGAKSNNGLLLMVTIDRKKYRFITGYGLEGTLPDAALITIGNRYLVPSLKKQLYGEGIIKTIGVIKDYLNQPANSRDLEALTAKDRVEKVIWYPPPIFSIAILIIGYVLLSRHIKKKTPSVPGKLLKDTSNQYDKAIIFIVIGLFFACFAGVFICAFTIRFAWIKSIELADVPLILYALIAIAVFLRYLNTLSVIRKLHTDDLTNGEAALAFQKAAWWYIILSPLVLIIFLLQIISRKKNKHRFLPHLDEQGNQLTRVNRDENISGGPYLTAAQKAEEREGVYSYDIWLDNANTSNFKIIANEGNNFGHFDTCIKCGAKTLAKAKVVPVIKPTYSHEGQGKKVRICACCRHEDLIKMVVLSKLVESSSGSSSSSESSSSSGGSSSSSSSGSFGGGSTGGGGAGGSW